VPDDEAPSTGCEPGRPHEVRYAPKPVSLPMFGRRARGVESRARGSVARSARRRPRLRDSVLTPSSPNQEHECPHARLWLIATSTDSAPTTPRSSSASLMTWSGTCPVQISGGQGRLRRRNRERTICRLTDPQCRSGDRRGQHRRGDRHRIGYPDRRRHLRVAFCTVFTFSAGHIRRVDSYIVPLTAATAI
jgi:hypothetical protein